jgi:hypothetical protein
MEGPTGTSRPTLLSATKLWPFHLGTASLLEGRTTDNAISLYRQTTRPNIGPPNVGMRRESLTDDRAGSEEAPEACGVSRYLSSLSFGQAGTRLKMELSKHAVGIQM